MLDFEFFEEHCYGERQSKMMNRLCSLILAMAIFASSAFGEGLTTPIPDEPRLSTEYCERFLSEKNESNLKGLIAGQKVFGNVPNDFGIDEQTASDLQIEKMAEIFDPYLYTDIAKARLRYRLRNPMLSSTEIRRDQGIIKYMIAHPEEFEPLRKHLREIRESFDGFLDDFEKFQQDPRANLKERIFATITWSVLLAPQLISHILPELTQVFHSVYVVGQWIAASIFTTLGWGNFKTLVTKKREDLDKYRKAMLTAKHSATALTNLKEEMAQEIRDHVNVIYEGNIKRGLTRRFLDLNAFLNREDKDLAALNALVKEKADFSDEGLFELNKSLRLMIRSWNIQLPYRDRQIPVPVPNFQQFMDNTFITNGQLRKLTRMIAERKEDLSRVLSALGELEVLLGVADCYRDNEQKWPISFPEILDANEETQLIIKEAHNAIIASQDPQESKGNDIDLSNKQRGFTVIMSETGGGASTYQEAAAQNQVLAQNGFFWFARQGRLTPGILMTAIDLRTGLGNRNYPQYEAQRIATIMKMSEIYPHSFTYITNPFTHGGEVTGLNIRAATLRGLVRRRTVGILATRSLGLYLEIENNKQIEKLYAENRRVGPFNPKEHKAGLLPDEYYNRLERDGMPADVMADARVNFPRLAERHLKGALDKPEEQ